MARVLVCAVLPPPVQHLTQITSLLRPSLTCHQFEEATAVGGGSLRLPNYRASYIRRYHPYIRWTPAPPRIVYFTVNPRLTIAELVQTQHREEIAPTASPLGIDILGAFQSQFRILVKDIRDDSGERTSQNEDRK
ncbi:hypothetical protein DL96DRAFT_1579317 [Flagelloscypha sp. PMI_526]|nr:hypothetical protein DL96DRAFT_1579317 [Flagelloscypha sp. PMI_526]